MIYQVSKDICTAFEGKGFKCAVQEKDSACVVMVAFSGIMKENLVIQLISREESHDVAIRVFSLADASAADPDRVLRLLNQLNRQYRYICFYLDEDKTVAASYDVPRSTGDEIGDVCCEAAVRFCSIIGESYPAIAAAVVPV